MIKMKCPKCPQRRKVTKTLAYPFWHLAPCKICGDGRNRKPFVATLRLSAQTGKEQ